MAQGYLQTVQQGANKSYQDLVDTAARLGAIQEEYEQRQAALEEQQKAGIRSGASQAAVLGGTLGWQNLKDYYNYVNKTGDWALRGGVDTATKSTLNLQNANAGREAISGAMGSNFNTAGPRYAYKAGTPIPVGTAASAPISTGQPAITTSYTPSAEFGANIDTAVKVAETAPTAAIQTAAPVTTPPVDTSSMFGFNAAPGATETGQVVSGVTKGAEAAIPAVETGLESASTAAKTATQTGALSTAMSSIGGLAGVGLGAYSLAKTGASVGNVSSMIGGGLMLGSLMEGAAFLGPWGLGIGLAGGIASSIFGW